MKPPSGFFLFATAILPTGILIGGPLNVANLSPGDIYKFTVASEGTTQDFLLSFGQTSGTFFLPEKNATLTVDTPGKPSVDVPPDENPRLAILHKKDDKLEFLVINSKPTPDEWSFRILNLGLKAVTIQHNKEAIEIAAGAEIVPEISGKKDIHLITPDDKRHIVPKQETEPTATLAVIMPSEEGWIVNFIMDR